MGGKTVVKMKRREKKKDEINYESDKMKDKLKKIKKQKRVICRSEKEEEWKE